MVETQFPPPKEAMRRVYVLRLWEARDFSRVRLHVAETDYSICNGYKETKALIDQYFNKKVVA